MANMKFMMEITDEDLWCYILCLHDRKDSGNNNTHMEEFLYREISRLEDIHEKWAKFASLENQGIEIKSVSV